MLRRVISVFKPKDNDCNVNGLDGNSARKENNNPPAPRILGSLSKKQCAATDPSDGLHHIVSRDGVAAILEKFSQVIHPSGRPFPTGTGDGSYGDDLKRDGSLADLKTLGTRDFETLNTLLKKELNGSNLTNDKNMLMEKTIQLLSNLPPNCKSQVTVTNKFAGTIWDSTGHPPESMLGDKYNYRQADGSHNNAQFPNVGKARTSYARSIPPLTIQPNPKVDPGYIFDSIMSRENGGFKPHPNNVSSMLYYMATIIIHDCFRTSHADFNISETSSYLDLSPLYGSNQAEQDAMRALGDGKLKPDCFSDKRILLCPPGVGCILIMFNRFHNYVVEHLANINEGSRFTKPGSNLTISKQTIAYAKYDEDLFQTGRLITCGLYINIILNDYLRTIVGLNRVNSTWNLDPRVATDHLEVPRGLGNQCSAEFYLIYRWNSCISQKDERWAQGLYKKIFGKDNKNITMQQLFDSLSDHEMLTPEDPTQRDFNSLKRDADGLYNPDELVAILAESIEEVAGAAGANNIPALLRAVEILGMEQARAWRCGTLNEFRKFLGLNPHKTFEDINSDPAVASKLKVLFEHPDFVEMYPGLVCEEVQRSMDPAVGICQTYTISRAILSDLASLVRGDRFYTVDYHPANLTNWGYSEAAYDLSINQGCVFYKLFIRAFPNHFAFNSIYAHYPLTIPSESKKIMGDLGRTDDYSWETPALIPGTFKVTSYKDVKTILKNGDIFGVDPWRKGLFFLMGKPGGDFMLAGDGPFYFKRRTQMQECLYQENWRKDITTFYENITVKLLKQWSHKVSGAINQVDIIRDVGNLAHVYFAANIFHLPLKSEAHAKGIYTEHELYAVMALISTVIFFGDVDPAKTFALRAAALPLTQSLGKLIEMNVEDINKNGQASELLDPLFEEHSPLKDYGVHMVRQLLKGGLGIYEAVWSQILPTAGVMVANQAQAFANIIDFYTGPAGEAHLPEINRLAKLDNDQADELLLHYVMEAIRLNGTSGLYRKCHKSCTVSDGPNQSYYEQGDNVFVSFVENARDYAAYPNPNKVRLDRPINSYLFYGEGLHECIGGDASRVALTAMLKVVGRLDNLRSAPGAQGSLKKIRVGSGCNVYLDSFASSYSPFPTTLKIQWDGGLNVPKYLVDG